jgi:metal-dependent HD superfamily phosphatase/phosphodiesterase
MVNFIAAEKLMMNKHGETYAKIASASAQRMLDLLKESGIHQDIENQRPGDDDDADLLVLALVNLISEPLKGHLPPFQHFSKKRALFDEPTYWEC